MMVIHETSIVKDFPLRWMEILIGSMLGFSQIIEVGINSANPALRC